jgi:HAD superfamily hydrolase (TIGR01509 family)
VIDAFVFDFDGLIIDTEWCEYVSIAEQFEMRGHRYAVEHFQQFVGTAWPTGWTDELSLAVGEALDADQLHVARRARRDVLLHALGTLPGVVELLDLAAAAGLPAAVASSSTRDWVEPHLERLGLRDRFAAVLTRDDVERAKPAPDLFVAAARALGVSPERTVVFEDSFNGCTAARAAGMVCVVVPNRITTIQDFTHANLVARSLLDLDLELLRRVVSSASARPLEGPLGPRPRELGL